MKLSIPPAFPYQGSKRKLASYIMPCLPSKFDRLVEPFAGSAAITTATAYKGNTSSFWINDAHPELIELWKCIINSPKKLSNAYRNIWNKQLGNERAYYNEIRDKFNKTGKPELFLFLLARCVKAAIRYNKQGEFNNSPDHRRKGMQPDKMEKNISFISELLVDKTIITSLDYIEVLSKTTINDIVYMDPPYQGVCNTRDSRYVKDVLFEDFVEQLEFLNYRNIPYIISYDGRCGDLEYGKKLPEHLGLFHTELLAGKSTQATLLGRISNTYEALYLSPSLLNLIGDIPDEIKQTQENLLFKI